MIQISFPLSSNASISSNYSALPKINSITKIQVLKRNCSHLDRYFKHHVTGLPTFPTDWQVQPVQSSQAFGSNGQVDLVMQLDGTVVRLLKEFNGNCHVISNNMFEKRKGIVITYFEIYPVGKFLLGRTWCKTMISNEHGLLDDK